MNEHRRRIALLVNSVDSDYSHAIWHAVKRAAERQNAEVMAFTGMYLESPDPSEATRNLIYRLVNPRRIDGVAIVASLIAHHCGVAGVARLCQQYAPLPLCSIGLEVPNVPSLVVDNRAGMKQGVKHLIEAHGRRRIAFIAAQASNPESNLRLSGYRDALQAFDIPVDESLIAHADFTGHGGQNAIRRLLESHQAFDAVAAANDYMAMGAIDALHAAGKSVPNDVAVCGFDDSNDASCVQPSLTSLRQPAAWLGSAAVDVLLRQMAGAAVPACRVGGIELVRRESCGCGYRLVASLQPREAQPVTVREFLRLEHGRLSNLLLETVLDPNRALGDWPAALLDALSAELSDTEIHFEFALERILSQALTERIQLEEFQRAITLLRTELRARTATDLDGHRKLERVWHTARMKIGAASIRLVGRHRLELMATTTLLGRTSERFATALSVPLLKSAMAETLPSLNITQAAVSLYADGFGSALRPLFLLRTGQEQAVDDRPIEAVALAPDAALNSDTAYHSIAMPLTSGQECFGICVLSGEAVPNVYEALRQQISSGIRGIQLHRQMVAQVAMREKLDQLRLSTEARMAIEIQTAMLPRSIDVAGLEVSHTMLPATESGGDYYDVIPTDDGAWLAIGDVSGHGLGAGLIMLMLQSMVASLVRANPRSLPSELLNSINVSVYDNVRGRLGRDEYATLTLLRYERSGQLVFSGLHEALIVYRVAEQRCECITPPGFWVGALQELPQQPTNATLTLHDGDVLVLYTDGAIEPRNAHQQQFGLERLVALIESSATLPVVDIRNRIVAALRAWTSDLDDDLSLLLVRYHSP
jgi:DNA-binding LacI/PurR family transcriptional regulator/serine phosphatase RsbU (regulator of sigma subunit)